MKNAEYFKNRPDELATAIDRIIENASSWDCTTAGQHIAAFLCSEHIGDSQTAKGETTFIVTLDATNTIRGSIDDVEKTADLLETLYRVTAESALKNIFGDARDADDVAVRYTKVYSGGES
jgi:hypothetical protein